LTMQKTKPKLKIAWATHAAAKYACENWHYSKCIPKSKLVKFSVFEDGYFVGVIVYGCGATRSLVSRYGLIPEQGCELVRVALRRHTNEVSKMLSITLKMLKKNFEGLKIVVSFADPEQGHHGGIYQASNWLHDGCSQASDEYIYKGKRWQGRSFRNSHKGMENHPDVKKVKGSSKIRYVYPFCKDLRSELIKKAKKYPKRIEHESNAPDFQSGEGGAIPTDALHSNNCNMREVCNGKA
jgi:hypothetical protein